MMFDRLFNPWAVLLDWSNSMSQIWFGSPAVGVRRAKPADAARFAELHARSFAHPWSSDTFEQMMTDRSIDAFAAEAGGKAQGFILIRRVADEAELLSIAVDAAYRRCGAGRRLIEAGIAAIAHERIATLFLEVESGNTAALVLYERIGFIEVGRRKGYYRSEDGAKDALTMRLDLRDRPLPPPVLDV